MAKTKISEFSSTPANNTDIDSINIAEGCAPSNINDAIRELMAQLKDFQIGSQGDSFNGPIGTTTAAAGAFTTLSASSTVTLSGGTANGVTYLNGSKVLTSGSALTFDGTTLTSSVGTSAANTIFNSSANTPYIRFDQSNASKFYIGESSIVGGGGAGNYDLYATTGLGIRFFANAAEGMRLTSTGLGIGTSSPTSGSKLDVNGQIVAQNGSTSSLGYSFRSATTTGLYVNDDGVGANLVLQANGSSNYAYLSRSGNLGLGVTPSAWYTGYTASQVGVNGSIWANRTTADTNIVGIGSNQYLNSGATNRIYISNGYATRYEQASGAHEWYTAASGTAGNAISFTQAMTLSASGNLGIGTTTPSNRVSIVTASGSDGILSVKSPTTETAGVLIDGGSTSNKGALLTLAKDGTTKWRIGLDSAIGGGTNNNLNILGSSTDALLFGTNSAERARIDSSGNLLVGTTSQISAGKLCLLIDPASNSGLTMKPTANNYDATRFVNASSTQVGGITCTSTATTYNTSSDYRLKNTIAPMTGALAKVAQLKPCTYKWNADGSDGEGFIAHELAEVVPQCVTGEKDAVDEEGNPKYQGIDTSFLVATLTAALQELNAKFEAYVASHP